MVNHYIISSRVVLHSLCSCSRGKLDTQQQLHVYICKTYPQSSNRIENVVLCTFLITWGYKYGIKVNEVLVVDANYVKIRLPNWVLKIRKELSSIFVKPFHHFLNVWMSIFYSSFVTK